jgi:hypothetical protein
MVRSGAHERSGGTVIQHLAPFDDTRLDFCCSEKRCKIQSLHYLHMHAQTNASSDRNKIIAELFANLMITSTFLKSAFRSKVTDDGRSRGYYLQNSSRTKASYIEVDATPDQRTSFLQLQCDSEHNA